jgi:FMN-dependent NADH-azoreductase
MGNFSATSNVGKAFCTAYSQKFPDDAIKVVDCMALAPFTAARVQAKFKCFSGDPNASDDVQEWLYTKQLIEEFKAADKYVVLAPMWNLWIPNQLKLYIDHIVQPALTFSLPDIKGMVTGKPVLFIRASGGVEIESDLDPGTKYLKAVFGFIGFTDMRVLGISPTGDQAGLPALLEQKSKEAAEMAADFVFNADAKPDAPVAPAVPDTNPAEVKEGSKVLFITSSPLGEYSATFGTGKEFVKALEEKVKANVTTLDLSDCTMAPFTATRVQAKFATWGGGKDAAKDNKEWEVTTALIKQMQDADVYVFAVPMWNLAIPNQLKLYLDHVVQPHQTFNPATNSGLLEGKRAFVIACSGNGLLGSPVDHVTPFMKMILGFIGVSDVSFNFVSGKDGIAESVKALMASVKLA